MPIAGRRFVHMWQVYMPLVPNTVLCSSTPSLQFSGFHSGRMPNALTQIMQKNHGASLDRKVLFLGGGMRTR